MRQPGIVLGARAADIPQWDSRNRHLNSRLGAGESHDRGVAIIDFDLPDMSLTAPSPGIYRKTIASIRHNLGRRPMFLVYMSGFLSDNPFNDPFKRYAVNEMLLGVGGGYNSSVYAEADEEWLYIKRQASVLNTTGNDVPDSYAGMSIRAKYIIINAPALNDINVGIV